MPVNPESVPIHLVGEESPEIDEALAQVIVDEPGYWETYGPFLGALHPNVFKETDRMAATKRKRGDLDLRPFIENMGMKKILAAMNATEIKEVIQSVGVDRFLESLSAQDRKKLKEQLK